MKRILRIIFDTIFPPTAHERLLRKVTDKDFCSRYQLVPVGRSIALAPYNSRTVQAAVAACKFEKNQHAAALLSTLLHRWLIEHQTSGVTILIPIPLSKQREAKRGFNQVTRVLEQSPPLPGVKINKYWLTRPFDTVRQTSLGRSARLKNLTGAFAVNDSLEYVNWIGIDRVIICDDVITTGATLATARATIQASIPPQVKVICIAWAH